MPPKPNMSLLAPRSFPTPRRSPLEDLHRALYNPAAQDLDSPWIELLHKRSEAPIEKLKGEEGSEKGFLEEHGEFLLPLSILGGAALFIWWKTRQGKPTPQFFPPAATAAQPSATPAPTTAPIPAPTASAVASSPEVPPTP